LVKGPLRYGDDGTTIKSYLEIYQHVRQLAVAA